MSITINNNIASLMAQRNLSNNSTSLSKSIERLSSGYRINRASDDAAGLSISESLRGQIRGNTRAASNIQDGINLLQIAEGGLQVISENIQRIRELCVQAANDTNGSIEKNSILREIQARIDDIDRMASTSRFNNTNLLDGTAGTDENGTKVVRLQVGANADKDTNTIDVSPVLQSCKVDDIGLAIDIDLDDDATDEGINGTTWSGQNIRSYITSIDSALSKVLERRSSIGALQNRLESALENINIMNENVQSSESRIRDLDIAKETANLTKYQILQQASSSVLAQANQIPQLALSLLRG